MDFQCLRLGVKRGVGRINAFECEYMCAIYIYRVCRYVYKLGLIGCV